MHTHDDTASLDQRRVAARPFQVDVTAWSSAQPEEVFRLLADVTTWTEWAGFTEAYYEREGATTRHGVGAARRFRAGRLASTETVLEFEPGRRLVYDYVGTMPFDDYRAEVTLSRSRGGTRISWYADFSPAWPLTGWLLRRIMTRVLSTIARRLALAANATRADSPTARPAAAAAGGEAKGREA